MRFARETSRKLKKAVFPSSLRLFVEYVLKTSISVLITLAFPIRKDVLSTITADVLDAMMIFTYLLTISV